MDLSLLLPSTPSIVRFFLDSFDECDLFDLLLLDDEIEFESDAWWELWYDGGGGPLGWYPIEGGGPEYGPPYPLG